MAYVGDSVTFNAEVTGGYEPYTYEFTDNEGNNLESTDNLLTYLCNEVSTGKIFKVKVTDDSGRVANAQVSLKIAEPFDVTLSTNNDHIFENTSARIDSVVSGGFSTYKYSYTINGEPYSSTSAYFTYSFKTAGVYNFKVTAQDKKGTQKEAELTVYVAPKLTINHAYDSLYVYLGTTAPIEAVAEGGFTENAGYSFVFKVNDEEVQADDNIYNFTPTTSGTYVIQTTVTDEYGNTATATNTFKVEPKLSVTLEASKTKILLGEKVTLTTQTQGGFAPFKYKYSYADGTSISGTAVSTAITPSKVGDYDIRVTVTDASGNSVTNVVDNEGLILSVANKLNLVTSVSDEAIFKGESAEFTANLTGGFPEYTYEFSYGENNPVPSEGNKAILTPNENGDYVVTITATDSQGNSLNQTKTIKVADQLKFEVNTSKTEFIVGDSATFTNELSGGFEPVKVTYSVTNGGTVSVVNDIGTFKPSKSGDYIVTVTATDNFKHTVPIDIPIKVVDKLSTTLAADNQNVFVGQKATLTANVKGGFEPYTYEYTLDDGTPIGTDSSTYEFVPADVSATPINVTVTDSKGNTATSRIVVNSAEVFDAELEVSADHVLVGSKVTFKAVPTGGYPTYTYKYTNDEGTSLGTSATYTFAPTEPGTYTINCTVYDKYKNEKNFSETIYVAESINASISASVIEAQPGESITFTAHGSGGFGNLTYTFKTDSGIISTGTNNAVTLGATKDDTYSENITVVVEDSYGCSASDTVKVVYIGEFKVQFTPSPARIVKGKSVKFTALATGGISPYTYSYSYVGDDTPITSTNSYFTISPKNTGFTTVKAVVTDSNGETKEATATVEVADALALSLKASSTMAYHGESVTITADVTGGYEDYSYIFTDAQNNVLEGSGNTRTVSFNEDGSYTIKATVQDSEGNTTSKSVIIKVCEEPSVSLKASAASVNVNESITLTTTVTGGFTSYTYKYAYENGTAVSGTSASTTITPKNAGNYTVIVTVTDKKGTVKTDSVSFTVYGPLAVSLNSDKDYAFTGSDVTFTANAGGGKGTYNYVFTDNNGNTLTSNGNICVVKATETGSLIVNVEVTDSENTKVTASKTVTVAEPMTITFSPSVQEANAGTAFKLVTTVSGGFPTYTYTVTDSEGKKIGSSASTSVTVKKVGTYSYTVEVKDKAGNIKTASTTVVVKTDLAVELVASKETAFRNETITVTANATGGASTKSYQYTVNGESVDVTDSQIVVGPDFGTYEIVVVVTDANENTATDTKTVSIKDCDELINNSTIQTNEITLGKSLRINAACEGGVAPYTYTYRCKENGSTTWTNIGEANVSSTTCNYTPTTKGTCAIQVIVKDSIGSVVSKDFTLNVIDPLTNNSTISETSVKAGTAVKLTASASGGTSPYTYTYRYRELSTSTWTYLGATNVSTTTYTYTPTASGTYVLQVLIKDAKGTVVSKGFTLIVTETLKNNSTISANTVIAGNAVTLTAKATGGTAPYTYTYRCQENGSSTWKYLAANITKTTFNYKPTEEGLYSLQVLVKDDTSTVVGSSVFKLNVTPALKNTSTISADTVAAGSAVTLTAEAAGGTGSYTYTFRSKKSNTTTWKYLGATNVTNPVYNYIPTEEGTYDVQVLVKDSSSKVVVKGFKLNVTAYVGELKNNSTISSTAITMGNSATLTAKAEGGTAPYTYTYRCRETGTTAWKYLGATNVSTATYKYTPSAVGTYTLQVLIKDADSTVVVKGFTLKVTEAAASALVNNSTISSTSVNTGDTVTLTAKASGGISPYTYTYRYRESGTTTWKYLGSTNVKTTTYDFTTTEAGTYVFQVLIKDAGSTVVSKGFTVKVV